MTDTPREEHSLKLTQYTFLKLSLKSQPQVKSIKVDFTFGNCSYTSFPGQLYIPNLNTI